VSIGRIHSLYRVSLLGMDNVESRARKFLYVVMFIALNVKGKSKVIPLQARCGPEGG